MLRASVFRAATAAAAALLVLVSLPAEAQWKWKDKGGRVQYSDLPPPAGTPDQDILSRPNSTRRATAVVAPAASAASAATVSTVARAAASAPRTDPELEAKLKKQESDTAAKKKADEERIAAAKADNCNRARAQMRTYDSGVRVFQVNEKGEREFVDDKQRAEETRRAKDVIAADCPK